MKLDIHLEPRLLNTLLTMIAFCAAYIVHTLFIATENLGLSVAEFLLYTFVVIVASRLVYEWLAVISQYSKPVYGRHAITDDVKLAAGNTIFIITLVWIFDIHYLGRDLVLLFFVFTVLFKICLRLLIQKRIRAMGGRFHDSSRNLLIIGSKKRALDIIHLVINRYLEDYRILGCLEVDSESVGKEVLPGIKVIGTISDLEDILKNEAIDEVVFAIPLSKIDRADEYILIAEDAGAYIRIIPDWQIYSLSYKPHIASLIFEPFLGLPTMTLVTTLRGRFALMVKDAFDFSFALLAIVFLSPIFLGIALAIKIKSPGPILFRQERVGLNGRRFTMYKFRTMVPNAEELRPNLQGLNESDGPVFKIENDPRIIPGLGHFLRRTSLDELPQFFNIIAGQMSVVGPRPPIRGEVVRYEVPQLRRLSVKPGLTCLWQSMPARNKVGFKIWVEKDLEYIDTWSLWLDMKILLRTFYVVLSGQGQ